MLRKYVKNHKVHFSTFVHDKGDHEGHAIKIYTFFQKHITRYVIVIMTLINRCSAKNGHGSHLNHFVNEPLLPFCDLHYFTILLSYVNLFTRS